MGLATAKALGVFGPVLVGGRNQQRLDNAIAELEAAGIDAYGKTVDIASKDSLDDFAKFAASIALSAATAFLSIHGICTNPLIGSQVKPRWCSNAISAAYSICDGLPPKS